MENKRWPKRKLSLWDRIVWRKRNRQGIFRDEAQEIAYMYPSCPKCSTYTINKLCPKCGWNGITKFRNSRW